MERNAEYTLQDSLPAGRLPGPGVLRTMYAGGGPVTPTPTPEREETRP